MAKEKVTITLDRSKAETAKSLVRAGSTSEVIEVALDHLIRTEHIRRDIAAYRRIPPTDAEVELATLADTTDLEDDTDWEALYPEDER